MLRLAIATLVASAVVATALPNPSYAVEPTKKHRRHQPEAVQYVAAPGPYAGLPANYYPAPPFPFFLLPGPWWLPPHP
jgi:hypothetical protein